MLCFQPFTAAVRITTDNSSVIFGSSTTLRCNVEGNPEHLAFLWRYEGNLLPNDISTLTIPSFTAQDVGTYTCDAINLDGDGRGNISIEGGGEIINTLRFAG